LIHSGTHIYFALAQSSTEAGLISFHAIVARPDDDAILSWGYIQRRSKHFGNSIRSVPSGFPGPYFLGSTEDNHLYIWAIFNFYGSVVVQTPGRFTQVAHKEANAAFSIRS